MQICVFNEEKSSKKFLFWTNERFAMIPESSVDCQMNLSRN